MGTYLDLPGAKGDWVTTPPIAAYTPTNTFDARVHLTPVDWFLPTPQFFITQWTHTAENQRGFSFKMNHSGNLGVNASSDGLIVDTNVQAGILASAKVPFINGESGWVRFLHSLPDQEMTFYTSTDGENWTQLGEETNGTVGSQYHPSTAPLGVGGIQDLDTEWELTGAVHRAMLIVDGTIVFDADFTILTPGVSQFTAKTGQTLLVNGNASIAPAGRIDGMATTFNRPQFAGE